MTPARRPHTGPLATAALFGLAAMAPAQPGEPPSGFHLHPGLAISPFAAEPDVVDPVAMCFDAAGRAYVVEMRGYPYGLPGGDAAGGRVRLLEDGDGDGSADRSTVFAEGLSFPTSIAPWRGGVIVAAPPALVYLEDTGGDRVADVRRDLFSGFALGVTDSNMSGLRWGPDNWLHGVNGGNGGSVSAHAEDTGTRLGSLDFRVRPDTGEIETTYSTGGGFGLVFDDWGRSFTPHNINHIKMRVLPARALDRAPGLKPTEGTASISDHGEMARIFAVSEPRTRPNHPEQAGHFSSAGGMGHIGNLDFPEGVAGSILVCDVVGNLVHRDVLTGDGPVPVASRAEGEEECEFLASTDPDFRPTGLELGPDGALYLTDMQRTVIEHPDYIPEKMRAEMDIRAGDDRGRVYRIAPASGLPPAGRPLSELDAPALVAELASDNQWRRATAQRLLVEAGATAAAPALKGILTDHPNPRARLHALWTLDGLGELTARDVQSAIADPEPGVAANAVALAGRFLADHPELASAVREAALGHPSAPARFQAVLATGGHPGAALKPGEAAGVLLRDGSSHWVRSAVLCSFPGDRLSLLEAFAAGIDGAGLAQGHSETVLGELGEFAGATLPDRAPPAWASALGQLAGSQGSPALLASVLDGVRTGLARRHPGGSPPADASSYWAAVEPVAAGSEGSALALRTSAWSLARTLGLPAPDSLAEALASARTTAVDASASGASRVEAVGLLSLDSLGEALPVLRQCLRNPAPEAVQHAALEVLKAMPAPPVAEALIGGWPGLHPALKRPVTLVLLRNRSYHPVLLDAIEAGSIAVGELNLDLEDRRTLLRWSTPDVHERAAALLGDGEYGNRQEKVDEWLARLPATGDAGRGREVFGRACASCHRAGDLGHDVGPDLGGLAHRSAEDLVANIIDPNMAIDPNYLGVVAETRSGELVSGIIRAESPGAITLLQQGGIPVTLARADIAALSSTGMSLMPEGLESTLTPQELRDLVEFMQGSGR